MSFAARLILCVWFAVLCIGVTTVSLDLARLSADYLSGGFFLIVGGSLSYACYRMALQVFP